MLTAKESKEIILKFQHRTGSFPAAPNFAPYKYCWLRDGSFIAYALSLAGEEQAAAEFFNWVDNVIKKHQDKVFRAIALFNQGKKLHPDELLHTRYTLDGEEGKEPWGNFQLDGYGTYLWALAQFQDMYSNSKYLGSCQWSTSVISDYLIRFWHTGCLDCWEETEGVHAATLATIYGGLSAQANRGNLGSLQTKHVEVILDLMKKELTDKFTAEGHFKKNNWTKDVDASLLWLAVPFGMVGDRDDLMVSTVKVIEKTLLLNGGVKRYSDDQYYGGGGWIPLTAWLGWYYVKVGHVSKAKLYLEWIENQSREKDNYLPEQVIVKDCPQCEHWVNKWGPVATPLLWSHAMHLILHYQIKKITDEA